MDTTEKTWQEIWENIRILWTLTWEKLRHILEQETWNVVVSNWAWLTAILMSNEHFSQMMNWEEPHRIIDWFKDLDLTKENWVYSFNITSSRFSDEIDFKVDVLRYDSSHATSTIRIWDEWMQLNFNVEINDKWHISCIWIENWISLCIYNNPRRSTDYDYAKAYLSLLANSSNKDKVFSILVWMLEEGFFNEQLMDMFTLDSSQSAD